MIAYTQGETIGRESIITNLRYDLKGSTSFPEWVFALSKLQELYLFNAQIDGLHFDAWPWPELEKLKLINLGLKLMLPSSEDLPKLRLLDLSDNVNLTWPGHFLERASQLEALHFQGNHLSDSKMPGLKKLGRLRILQVVDNKLGKIPDEVFQLKNLRTLDVSQNQIGHIPGKIGQLENLDQLLANKNRIKKLPTEIGKLRKLSHLQLRKNRISALPKSMHRCTMLRKLDLSLNKLHQFPTFLADLPWLSELNLGNNQIKRLPDSTGVFKQLTKLVLSKNSLSSFSLLPWQLPKLRELDLDQNHLQQLPELSPDLFSLKAAKNFFRELPPGLLKLPGLKDLNLSDNQITHLPESFGSLEQSLIRLDLARNPVSCEAEALLSLRQLKELNGLIHPARRKKVLLALQSARRLDLPPSLDIVFYRLLNSPKTVLPGLSPDAILLALNHPNPKVVAQVRRFIQKDYGQSIKGRRLRKGHTLGIIGRSFFKKDQLKNRLGKLGIQLQEHKDIQACTHLLLGFPPITQEIRPDQQVILNERDLSFRLDQLEKKSLLKEKSPSRLARLKQLLTSPDTTNIRLGFRMITGNGLPPVLWNELLAAYYLCERDPGLQLQIKSYIRLRLVDDGKNKFFAVLTPQLIKWGKIKPEKEQLMRRNRFDLELVRSYLR